MKIKSNSGESMVKSFKLFMGLLFVGLIFTPAVSSESKVDGELRNGYRILFLQDTDQVQKFGVYRGDYIKFRLPDRLDGQEIVFPTLDERKKLAKDIDTAAYIKMKQVGDYPFSIGSLKGIITVTEYEQTSYKAVTAEEGDRFIKENSPLILDVRTPQEYEAGHLENAVLLPVQILQANLDKLEKYKQQPVFIYCATGNRSTVASKILIDSGFKNIVNLRSGIKDWFQKKFPVVR